MAILSLAERLDEARSAYHDLSIGKAIARARDSNGEEVSYTQADRASLRGYIASLEAELANPDGGTTRPIGPLRFSF